MLGPRYDHLDESSVHVDGADAVGTDSVAVHGAAEVAVVVHGSWTPDGARRGEVVAGGGGAAGAVRHAGGLTGG